MTKNISKIFLIFIDIILSVFKTFKNYKKIDISKTIKKSSSTKDFNNSNGWGQYVEL